MKKFKKLNKGATLADVEFHVKNYNEDDNTLQDVIKIVTLKVKYGIYNQEEQITISKLKIREI